MTKKAKNGAIIMRWADGFKLQQNADGSSIEVHPDGTQVGHFTNGIIQMSKPGGYRKQQVRGWQFFLLACCVVGLVCFKFKIVADSVDPPN